MTADPLHDAERQMFEHEAALYRALREKLRDRLMPDPDRPVSDEERRAIDAALRELVAEDPEARDLAERLAALHRFRVGE